jgi:hypothetical protein
VASVCGVLASSVQCLHGCHIEAAAAVQAAVIPPSPPSVGAQSSRKPTLQVRSLDMCVQLCVLPCMKAPTRAGGLLRSGPSGFL